MNIRPAGHKLAPYVLLVLFIGIGMFLAWYSTVWGAGLISDSFQYIASARNLVSGHGLSLPYGDGELMPMTKYPPMFPIALSAFELVGVSAMQGARVINIILFGVNIILVFYCTKRLAHSIAFSLVASLLVAISFVLVEVHSWALSEPLYIFLSLSSFLLIQRYFEKETISWLISASLAASAAFLTRYVGVSLVLSIAIILLLYKSTIKQKGLNLFLFGAIAILPMVMWSLRGYLLTRTLNDRTISFHPLTLKNYAAAIDVLYGWFFPTALVQGAEKIFLALTAVAAVILLLFFWRSRQSPVNSLTTDSSPEKRMLVLHGIYIVFYGIVIIVSKTWLDADIGLSDRILSPMLVSMIILLAVGLSFLWNNYRRTRPLVILIGLGLVTYYAIGTSVSVQGFHVGGIGIARRGWQRSEVIQSLRSYGSDPIYTNSNSSLYLWSDRGGYGIPDFELLKQKGTNTRAVLVIFHHVPPTGKRLEELISGLKLLNEDQVASVYALDP